MRVLAIARAEGIFDVARKKKTLDRSAGPTYDAILADVVGLVDACAPCCRSLHKCGHGRHVLGHRSSYRRT